ncbi:LysR family transcriptional regulator [Ligilactobacillus pobuzihii]|uniref:LysR substrate-binding domain-containing protein n=1 Tax=Ligilactobacillus pobuzihii TaxID=449659 RepID=UPI0019CFDC0D|nr:LysR substrate-binding domain-containing protein [Ligilactobacillus pobuzihii]MBN7274460.1 LysR family transcriptional regulator [Ligilactobacillus pobuzihii]
MKLKDLRYFCYLCQVGSFTETAKHFNVKQPTVTLAIKRLESSLHIQLIYRDHSQNFLKVTSPGKILYEHATSILNEVQLAKIEINNFSQEKIRFGLPPIIGNLYLPLVVPELNEKNLLQNMIVDESGSEQLTKDLIDGKIDIGLLGSFAPINDPRLSATRITSRDFAIISSNKHWLNNYTEVSFSDLKGEQFISLDSKFIHRKVLQHYSSRAGFTPNIIFKTQSISILKRMVEQNSGIALLVGDAVALGDKLKSTPLTDEFDDKFNISIVTRKNYLLKNQEWELVTQLLKIKDKLQY